MSAADGAREAVTCMHFCHPAVKISHDAVGGSSRIEAAAVIQLLQYAHLHPHQSFQSLQIVEHMHDVLGRIEAMHAHVGSHERHSAV